ncbi:hypothetical protein DRE_01179 [Drechslerella stenobrocha 248]|uniref:Uncharacterized protein n=1 Tax=Drechslerella stenobrocha 248 TaxID=1043628 RepID=W7HWN4_9PEZI|nr:hypothetical protein DRE_01179 [Drechslerella stenobrocha 248]
MRSLSRLARIASILSLTALVSAEDLSPRDLFPFFPAHQVSYPQPRLLRRNDGNCPKDTHSCASISYPGFCCINAARCALDNSGHIACCPNGIICSGSVAQEGDSCNTGYYSCPDNLFSGGCCLNGYEYCSKNRCIGSRDAIASVVAVVPGLITSATNGGIGVYRTVTGTAGEVATALIGDAGAVYSSYIANPASAVESWFGSAYTYASSVATGFPIPTVGPGIISSASSEYSDFRSNLGAWYTSFTSANGPGYTSLLNNAGQYVTTIPTVINGVTVETAVTVQFPAFGQAVPTTNVAARRVVAAFVGDTVGGKASMVLLWAWTIGLGLFTAVVGWL